MKSRLSPRIPYLNNLSYSIEREKECRDGLSNQEKHTLHTDCLQGLVVPYREDLKRQLSIRMFP